MSSQTATPKPDDAHPEPTVMYRNRSSLKVGELNRFVVEYTPSEDDGYRPDQQCLWLRVRNMEAVPFRAAYLAGPYILYVDVRPDGYDQHKKLFSTAEQPSYESQLKAGQSFYAQLYMNKVQDKYTWTVDVVSQVLFSTSVSVQFELLIGSHKSDLHQHTKEVESYVKTGLNIKRLDTLDIWHSPRPRQDEPVHLVLVTHGLHSNTGTDMLFLKEKIDEMAKKTGENIIVRGFHNNACKTEKGIKYLGKRVADYVLNELVSEKKKEGEPNINKISFIGHSLGGLVQVFAMAHIQSRRPQFFDNVEPINFITMATPHLGISNENPGYVKFALDIGFAGKTGQDLGLTWKPSTRKHHKPLLQVLPTGPAHEALKRFKHRTLYANAVNDGIVPLRTSAILYLDWKGLGKAARAKRGEAPEEDNASHRSNDKKEEDDEGRGSPSNAHELGEIPEDDHVDEPQTRAGFLQTFTKQSSDLVDSITGPFNSMLSFLAPQAGGKKPGKIYQRSQTLSQVSDSEEDEGDHVLPKKTSMLESGVSVLLPPLPSNNFIIDPDSRPPAIFHDREYSESDLPKRRFKTRSFFTAPMPPPPKSPPNDSSPGQVSLSSSSTSSSPDMSAESNLVEKAKVEEKIAREWHRGMVWRKVLVRLEPDAHNNIVVRRRFSNAYGWPVIDHLVSNHFGPEALKVPTSSPQTTSRIYKKSDKWISPVDVLKSSDHVKNKLPWSIPENGPATNKHDEETTNNPSIDSNTNVSDNRSCASPSIRQRASRSSTLDSNSGAWDQHLHTDEEDGNEEEGIVHSVGAWMDGLRDLGNLNINAFVDANNVSVDEQERKRAAELMEQPPHY